MQPAAHSPVYPLVTAIHASEVPVQGCDDGPLASRIAAGDLQAAEEMVRRHQSSVRGFLRAVSYDRQAIDDLAQETFLRAIAAAGRFDPAYPMRGWLITIARRLSINHGQKQKRRRTQPGLIADELHDRDGQSPSGPLEQAERMQLTKQTIDHALGQLTEPQRTTLVMHYNQGLALDDIAGLLEMKLGTVKSHLHRGRARMRELLEPKRESLMP